MAIYALSDLHLSLGIEGKPMDIFGYHWENHFYKIKEKWEGLIKEDDVVLIAGDFSWAMYLEESLKDFKFLEGLPGKKIMLKGNHDYWWSTLKKMNDFLEKNEIKSIKFLYNNAIELNEFIVAGTRYWAIEESINNEKIFNRECERATISLKCAQSIDDKKPIIFMTHYPPDERIIDYVEKYNIKYWIYGHIHSNYEESLVYLQNIKTFLTSCDYLNFMPIKIHD